MGYTEGIQNRYGASRSIVMFLSGDESSSDKRKVAAAAYDAASIHIVNI